MVVKYAGVLNYECEIIGVPNKGSLLERTAGGGIVYEDIQEDEFGNDMKLTIELTGQEIEVLKSLFQNDLL